MANLCPRERLACNKPNILASLKSQGQGLAEGPFELAARPRDATESSLAFEAYQQPVGAIHTSVPRQKVRVTADFRTDLGRLCLRSMSVCGG